MPRHCNYRNSDSDSDDCCPNIKVLHGRQGPKGPTLDEQIGQLEKKLQEIARNKTVNCGICLQEAEGVAWSSRNKIEQRMCFDCLYDQALATFAMKSWDVSQSSDHITTNPSQT